MNMKNIEHVVLLMLENRSFDSMLGWLYEHKVPASPPAHRPGWWPAPRWRSCRLMKH